ncbi:MaoC/PaaZ C-terminal domain-containing protein [Floricoccus penangensis]|uniref:Enoyl-CoA hydratase n=1 Tax=Floricoccus penangensis TaxID=1859475 RepID=A0A9Q5JFW6_9LACT|nr:MaoC/PaaZ C-terminal domain-containing protein [Floricoccus penangensis]OFI46619.1 enoyl-CoA hydratase [Floricoccus penangensis]URZ86837.1 MaoC family dehydratase N-terminal domain-containing protein [Floricoccus penangensis]
MNLRNKDIKIGKTISEIQEGETFSLTEKISEREILLYLGLTTDDNPLFLQYDYVKEIGLKKPLVPTTLIFGIMTSTVSKYLPGPGSNVVNVTFNISEKIFRGDTLKFDFEVIKIDTNKDLVTINVEVTRGDMRVGDAILLVTPPGETEIVIEE